ncbi:hypothetical protein CR513_05574, partial [Mucuna pruriens]
MSPYQIIFSKACHLLVKIKHRAYWMKLEELRLEVYENSQVYKEKVKHFHDSRILRRSSRSAKRWDKPFVVTNAFPYSIVEVRDVANNRIFKLKPYHEGPNLNSTMGEVEIITLAKLIILEDPPEEVVESPNA